MLVLLVLLTLLKTVAVYVDLMQDLKQLTKYICRNIFIYTGHCVLKGCNTILPYLMLQTYGMI